MPIHDGALQKIVAVLRGQRVGRNDPELMDRVQELMFDYGLDGDDDALLESYLNKVMSALGGVVAAPSRRGAATRSLAQPQRNPPAPEWLSSPFRFVALSEKVAFVESEVARCGQDMPLPGGFCGTIEVDWAAETPLLIGAQRPIGNGQTVDAPMQLGPQGPWVIPGTTLRGLLRSTCEIIAYGRLWQANRHHRYAIRDFTHPLFADDKRPSWASLNSGWLCKSANSSSGYEIVSCHKYLIRVRDLPTGLNGGNTTSNGAFHREWLNKDLSGRYQAARQAKNGNPHFSGTAWTFTLVPGSLDQVVPDSAGKISGWFVFAGKSPTLRDITAAVLDRQDAYPSKGDQKKREYVFVDDPNAQAVPLSQDAFDRFHLAHTKPSRNKREPDGSYAVLHKTLKAGGRIPVFYIGALNKQASSDFSIGLTRLFKRGHVYSVQDKLDREVAHRMARGAPPAPEQRDMVEGLFGQVYEPGELGIDTTVSTPPADLAWKGRVAFGFARLQGKAQESGIVETVMMAPRASYAPFYLRGTYKDWSDSDARLAGRKRYFPQYPGARPPGGGRAAAKDSIYATLRNQQGNNNQELRSRLIFLEPAMAGGEFMFRGAFRLHNVSAAEIGMLLWALTHGGDPAKPYRHMIGRAKTAGAGQVRVKALRLDVCGNDAKADALKEKPADWELPAADREGWMNKDAEWSIAPFLREFEKLMRRADPDWPKTKPVLELLGCSRPEFGDAERTATPKRTRYIELQEFRQLRDRVKCHSREEIGVPQGPDRLLGASPLDPSALRQPYAK